MKAPVFVGASTAIATPFRNGAIDYEGFGRLIDLQIRSGINAITVCGTTGECSTLTDKERLSAIEFTVRRSSGLIKVIAGTGTNCTEKTVELSKQAQSLGADAVLAVTPYYNKTSQSGLVAHYCTVADSIDIPLIVYNVPSRTGVSCDPETYEMLSRHPNINGVKEASGRLHTVIETKKLCQDDFNIWSGNDGDLISVMLHGGCGVISVVGNLIPHELSEITGLCLRGEYVKAVKLYGKYTGLINALFSDVNPIPLKSALELMGLCSSELRLPLVSLSDPGKTILRTEMEKAGILPAL